MTFSLGPRQTQTVAAAITVLSTLVIALAVGSLLFIVGLFFQAFSHVFLPVAVAGVAALVAKPLYDWLLKFKLVGPVTGLVLVFVAMLIPLIALGWFFGAILVKQIAELVERLPTYWDAAREWFVASWPEVRDFWENSELGQRVRTTLQEQQSNVLQGLQVFGEGFLSAGRGALRGIGTLFTWAVLPVYFAFFLMARTTNFKGDQVLPFLKPETRRDVMYLAEEFVAIVVAFFRGQLLIAFLQGVLYAIGFSVVGLKYGLLLGLILGFLNIIPYLGSLVGLGVCLPLAFFQPDGGLITLLLVIGIFSLVQTIEGYVLTPKIMGDTTGLHPMVIMIAIFFWGSALGGITGMILAIPLTAFLVVFWRLARERYIPEIV